MQNQRPEPIPDVRALLDQARAADLSGKRDEASRLSQQALALAQERADRPGEANALYSWARAIYFATPSQARQHLDRALPLFGVLGDRYGQGSCLLVLGNIFQIQGEPGPALERYDAARKLFEETGAVRELATTLSNTGALFIRTGQPHRALESLLPARDAAEKAGDQAGVLRALGNIGAAYRNAQDMVRAKTTLDAALALAGRLGSKHDEGILWHNLGLTMQQLQGPREALECFDRALPLLEATSDRRAMGAAFASRAAAADQQGDLLATSQDLQRALEIFQAIGDKNGTGRVLHSLGIFWEQCGDWDEARRRYEEGLTFSKAAGDIHSQMLLLGALGELAGRSQDREREQAFFRAALSLEGADQVPVPRIWTLLSYSRALTRSGASARAIEPARTARDLARKTQDAREEGRAEIALGAAYQGLGRAGDARARYAQALTLCRSVNDVMGEAQAAALLGALEEDAGERTVAARHYRDALDLHESLRASLGNLDEAKVGYIENQIEIYRRYIRFLIRNRQFAEAFAAAQKAKARALNDRLVAGQQQAIAPRTEADRVHEERLTRQGRTLVLAWRAVQNERSERTRRTPRDPVRERALDQEGRMIQRRLQQLDREMRAFRERLYVADSHLADRRAARTATLAETGAMLPPDTALLEFVVLADQVALFVVTQLRGKPRLATMRLGPVDPALTRQIAGLRQACAGRPGTGAERLYQPLARALHRRLLAPARDALAGKKRLILCPDGLLWDVPFQALLDGSTFLWERYELVLAHSATAMKAARAVRTRPNRPRPRQGMLVIADPDLGAATTPPGASLRPFFARNEALGALPHTRVEASAIQAAVETTVARLGSDAQESFVKAEAGAFRYLHFATHALFNDAAPLLSGVVLSRPEAGSPEDGILTARELQGMNLSAELLVLSACETGRGVSRPGEGLIGLAWAAFVAGVPSQVVSQWSVDDAATAQLMAGFYRRLQRGVPRGQALREACLALRRDGVHAHPFYWAPFLLLGDWR